MKCCVQNCSNYNTRKRKKGISFHKFPKDPGHFAAWLEVLATPGFQINRWSVVCSEHFKPDCFDDKAPKKRIKSGAIPTILSPVNSTELKVCRVCFAVDVKMYDMKESKLSDMFHNVTGILACNKEDSLLHRLCWECAARLQAAAAFRDKALFSDVLLKDLTNIQLSDINSIKDTYSFLKSPFTVQTIFISTDSECDDSVSDTNEAETLVNDDLDLIARNTVTSNTQEDLDEAWIEAPIKTEAESDPIFDYKKADTNEQTHTENKEEDKITDTVTDEAEMYEVPKIDDADVVLEDYEEETSEPEENDDVMEEGYTSLSREDTDYKKADTNEQTHTENKEKEEDKITDTVTDEAEMYEVPKIDDADVVLEDHEEETSEPEENDDVMEEGDTSLSGEDPDELSVEIEAVKKGKSAWHTNRNNNFKEKIIKLKRKGYSTSYVASLLRTTRNTVRRWWERWKKEGHMNQKPRPARRKKTTPLEDQLLVQRVALERSVHTPTLAKQFGICARSVRRRLKEAGFTALRPKAQVPLRSGRSHVVDDDTKQKIVTMKLNGVSVTEIANQFRVTRTSVYRWFRDVRINETLDHITDTTNEDEGVSEDSEVKDQATIIKSKKSKWEKFPDV